MIERTKLTIGNDVTVVIWKSKVLPSFSVAPLMFQVGYRVQAPQSHKTSTESVASRFLSCESKECYLWWGEAGFGKEFITDP